MDILQVHSKIYVGSDQRCTFAGQGDWAVIHACKHPCHVAMVGYRGNLSKTHPNYLIAEKGKHLALNMVDMEQELHPIFTNPIMKTAMIFIEKYIDINNILIHCNQGQSRSPSIALIYLARKSVINNDSYSTATKDFVQLYQNYQPGNGITAYMRKNWDHLMKSI